MPSVQKISSRSASLGRRRATLQAEAGSRKYCGTDVAAGCERKLPTAHGDGHGARRAARVARPRQRENRATEARGTLSVPGSLEKQARNAAPHAERRARRWQATADTNVSRRPLADTQCESQLRHISPTKRLGRAGDVDERSLCGRVAGWLDGRMCVRRRAVAGVEGRERESGGAAIPKHCGLT